MEIDLISKVQPRNGNYKQLYPHTHVAQCYAKIPYHQCGLTGFKLDLRAENALTMSLAAVHYRQVLMRILIS